MSWYQTADIVIYRIGVRGRGSRIQKPRGFIEQDNRYENTALKISLNIKLVIIHLTSLRNLNTWLLTLKNQENDDVQKTLMHDDGDTTRKLFELQMAVDFLYRHFPLFA